MKRSIEPDHDAARSVCAPIKGGRRPETFRRRIRALSLLSVAALGVASVSTSAQAAKPDPNHPAVQRAQSHLNSDGVTAARVSAADSFEPTDLILDRDGTEHVRFDRRHQGLRVIGGDLVVHSDVLGRLRRVSLTLAQPIVVATTPAVSISAAQALALRKFPHLNGAVIRSELVIFARRSVPAPVLAFDVLIEGVRADGLPSRLHMLIDSRASTLLDQWDDIQTADAVGSGKSLYSGTVQLHTDKVRKQYQLRDTTRGLHYVTGERSLGKDNLLKDADNIWGDGTMNDVATVAVDAAYGQSMTWDYYQKTLGRNGIANDGNGAYSVVHAKDPDPKSPGYGGNIDNAWWQDGTNGGCFCMHYGDGLQLFNAVVSIDIAGHEMTHGVTGSTAKLIFSAESGGLNEATSDIFGTMVEYYANNASNPPNYTIGEKVAKSGKPLRYMYQPSLDAVSTDCWFPGIRDLDPHLSSGIANHFFYLLAEGSNPVGNPASPVCLSSDTKVAHGVGALVGIGRDKAAKIWYSTLTTELTSDTNYGDARDRSLLIAESMFGGQASTEYKAVDAAWSAVNVGIAAQPLNDTGVTAAQCYAAGSDALVSCVSAKAIALNKLQDGMVGRDVTSSDNSDGSLGFSFGQLPKVSGGLYDKTECVYDKKTGLMWEGKPASGPRAAGNTYTNWGDGSTADASAYVTYVNSIALCGFSDWRLPTHGELQSIVSYGVAYPGPTIDIGWFPNTIGWLYWTSSPYVGNMDNSSWLVGFDTGGVGSNFGASYLHVRLVR